MSAAEQGPVAPWERAATYWQRSAEHEERCAAVHANEAHLQLQLALVSQRPDASAAERRVLELRRQLGAALQELSCEERASAQARADRAARIRAQKTPIPTP